MRVALQTATRTSAATYMALGVDNSWSRPEFEAQFRVEAMHWSTPANPHSGWIDRSAIQFDLVGIDPAIANAFRRILISDLPTIAIEHVFMINNTSVMNVCFPAAPASHSIFSAVSAQFCLACVSLQVLRHLTRPQGRAPCQLVTVLQDEVLAHRLGLVPLKLDPELFQDKAGAPQDKVLPGTEG